MGTAADTAPCPCCASHEADAPGSVYFVTVVDGPRYGLAAGPYATHAAALGDVDKYRKIAEEHDLWATFYDWGTARVDGYAAPKEGRINAFLRNAKG